MSIKKQIPDLYGTYYLRITCHSWLPIFDIVRSYGTVYNWFDYLKKNHHFINGYVIMPNHFYALISFSNTGKNINGILGNGKRFMAYDIVEKLKSSNNELIVKQLFDAVNASDKKRGKLLEVLESSFDIKECFTEKFIRQKLNYIHFNPCAGKWNLADCPENYIQSSAKYYGTGVQGIYTVDNIMQMLDIDLSKCV